MEATNKDYCVILAGGIGGRLWPVSRKEKPKQFLDFFGCGRTMLQQTYERFARFVNPANIYISTNVEYRKWVEEQLPMLPREQILAEPIRRNTLPSIAWATLHISRLCPDANIVVTPADQLILNEELFERDILGGLKFVADYPGLLTMGVKASRPDTSYGYIQAGEQAEAAEIYKVKSFTEKPALEFAKMFVDSGEFYWNTGLYLWNVQTMMQTIGELMPGYMNEIADWAGGDCGSNLDDCATLEHFASLPNLSLDYGVLERSKEVFIQVCEFGWADFGSWHSVCEKAPCDANSNALLNTEALLYNSSGNVVCLPEGRIAVIDGLQDFVVAEEGNVLMICPKNDAPALRRMMTDARMKLGEDFV